MSTRWIASLIALVGSAGCLQSAAQCTSDADCSVGTCREGLCEVGPTPTAIITGSRDGPLGALIKLDGGASRTAEGTTTGLEYRWTLLEPAGASFEANTGTTVSIRLTKPHATYRVQLVTVDRGATSVPALHEVKVQNAKPVVKLTASAEVWGRNASIHLSAAGSTDADSDPLTFSWSLATVPTVTGATLLPGAAGQALLTTGATLARYTITVVANDGYDAVTETLSRTVENAPPTVDAGSDRAVNHSCSSAGNGKTCSASVSVAATASDPDGSLDVTTPRWRLLSAPAAAQASVAFANPSAATTTVTITNAAANPIVGDYVLEYSVADQDGDTGKDTVAVRVLNRAPTLTLEGAPFFPHTYNAAESQFEVIAAVKAGAVVDPDNDDVEITWLPLESQAPGATSHLSDDGSSARYRLRVPLASKNFLISPPDHPSYHRAFARVTDVNGDASTASYSIWVGNQNPTIIFRGDETPGHQFDGGFNPPRYFQIFEVNPVLSDADGDPLELSWSAVLHGATDVPVPAGASSTDASRVYVYATLPTASLGHFELTGTVTDGWASARHTEIVRFGNRRPIIQSMLLINGDTHTGTAPCEPLCFDCGCVSPVLATTFPGTGFAVGQLRFQVQVNVLDPDGDALKVRFTTWGQNGIGMDNAPGEPWIGLPCSTSTCVYNLRLGNRMFRSDCSDVWATAAGITDIISEANDGVETSSPFTNRMNVLCP